MKLVQPLSASTIASIKEVFDFYDKKTTKTIPAAELGNMIRSLGIQLTASDSKRVLQREHEKDKPILFHELVTFLESIRAARRETAASMDKQLEDIFFTLDLDKTGFIPLPRLRRWILSGSPRSFTEQQLDQMFTRCGLDKHTPSYNRASIAMAAAPDTKVVVSGSTPAPAAAAALPSSSTSSNSAASKSAAVDSAITGSPAKPTTTTAESDVLVDLAGFKRLLALPAMLV